MCKMQMLLRTKIPYTPYTHIHANLKFNCFLIVTGTLV